jgi:hypothetical protein
MDLPVDRNQSMLVSKTGLQLLDVASVQGPAPGREANTGRRGAVASAELALGAA